MKNREQIKAQLNKHGIQSANGKDTSQSTKDALQALKDSGSASARAFVAAVEKEARGK